MVLLFFGSAFNIHHREHRSSFIEYRTRDREVSDSNLTRGTVYNIITLVQHRKTTRHGLERKVSNQIHISYSFTKPIVQ